MITIKKDPNNLLVLVKNNKALSCPFQPVVPLQGRLQGQIEMLRQPCNDNCPFFDYDENNNRVILQCKDVSLLVKPDTDKPKLDLV